MITDAQQEALDAYRAHGSWSKAAAALGVTVGTLRKRVARAQKWIDAPEGQKAAIETAGLDIGTARHGWRVIPREDGGRESVFWVADKDDAPADLAAAICDAMTAIPAVPEVRAPTYRVKDTLTLYPVADAHIGMMAWRRETGEAYDTDTACARLISWLGQCVASAPASETAVILDVGDMTHADDQYNVTPKSKHHLDVDTRHFRTVEAVIQTLGVCVDLALQKHKRVILRILPGNHNPHTSTAVMFAMAQRYRENPRVDVQCDPGEFWAFQFGNCLLAAHHGDKAKAERMVMFLADQYAEIWGQTRHRFLWTGHLHHHRSADIGGVKWEQLRALTARDAYAVSHAYTARAQLQAVTYHKDRGEVARVSVGA